MLLQIILATLAISLISLVGILLYRKESEKSVHYLISFAAAILISVSFFELIPEALEKLLIFGVSIGSALIYVVLGILLFFLIERFIHWHHCGKQDCKHKPMGSLILIGDFIHNFIDGLLIAGAFLLSPATGIATTISVAIHEIPQEVGDFAVLIHSGIKKSKAILLNSLSALSAILGGALGFFIFSKLSSIIPYIVLIAAGGFIYISLSDIVPELHKHSKNRSIEIIEVIIFIATIFLFKFFLGAIH